MTIICTLLRFLFPTRIHYRGWQLAITGAGVVGRKTDNNELFFIGRLTSLDQGIRLAMNKVNRLEGPEIWNEQYTQEALQ